MADATIPHGRAPSDGPRQLTPERFAALTAALKPVAAAAWRSI